MTIRYLLRVENNSINSKKKLTDVPSLEEYTNTDIVGEYKAVQFTYYLISDNWIGNQKQTEKEMSPLIISN